MLDTSGPSSTLSAQDPSLPSSSVLSHSKGACQHINRKLIGDAIGAAIGSTLLIVVILCLVYYFRRRKRASQTTQTEGPTSQLIVRKIQLMADIRCVDSFHCGGFL